MRLWTLHPRYLDTKGLVALWREALLAQHVLLGLTRGYRCHPQLLRFRAQANPVACIATYLDAVLREAQRRGYRFDAARIVGRRTSVTIPATRGQLLYEWQHLGKKLARRCPAKLAAQARLVRPLAHPLFRIVPGGVAKWEKT